MRATLSRNTRATRRERAPFEGLAIAFAATVVCFSASTAYTALRTNELTGHSEVVSGDALPSVLELSRILRETRGIERGLDDVVEGRSTWAPEVIDAASTRIAAAVAVYRKTEDFEGEAEAWREASDALAAQRAALARLTERLSATGVDEASRNLFEDEVAPATDRVVERVADLIELNAMGGQAAAMRVEATRERIVRLALGLDALSLLFSLGAMALAVRAVRRHHRALNERADELEHFAARVAHDIRGLLGPALLVLESVATNAPDEKTERFVQRGTQSLARVRGIISDLLAFAESGGRPDLAAATPLGDAVANTLSEVESFAAERKTELIVDGIETVSVACAPGVLSSILSNLVRNSIKFMGASATRRVCVRATTRDDYALIEVEDTGPGIPLESQNDVFKPYVRGRRVGVEGLGLGLATVKRLVEAHGGTVGIRSAEGQGCTIFFRLPVRRTASANDGVRVRGGDDADVASVHLRS